VRPSSKGSYDAVAELAALAQNPSSWPPLMLGGEDK
jgi:hypothetical protein